MNFIDNWLTNTKEVVVYKIMTYQEKIQRVIDKLNGGDPDNIGERAQSILRAIGITKNFPNGQPSVKEDDTHCCLRNINSLPERPSYVEEEKEDEGNFGFH